jgi:hypothetical protein
MAVGLNCTVKSYDEPGAMLIGRELAPISLNDCPVKLICVTLVGAEEPFRRVTVLLNACALDTEPKERAVGEAVSESASEIRTMVVPHPVVETRKQERSTASIPRCKKRRVSGFCCSGNSQGGGTAQLDFGFDVL